MTQDASHWHKILEGQHQMLALAGSPESQREILLRIAEIHWHELGDAEAAAAAYEQVLERVPEDRETRSTLTDLYLMNGQAQLAADHLNELCATESSPIALGQLYAQLASIYRDELGDPDSALDFLLLTLDANFNCIPAFEAIVEILTDRHDWVELADQYREMIQRAHELGLLLKRRLAVLLRDRLNDRDGAIELVGRVEYQMLESTLPASEAETRDEVYGEIYTSPVSASPEMARPAVESPENPGLAASLAVPSPGPSHQEVPAPASAPPSELEPEPASATEPATELVTEGAPTAIDEPRSERESTPTPIAGPMPQPIAGPMPQPIAAPTPKPLATPTPKPIANPVLAPKPAAASAAPTGAPQGTRPIPSITERMMQQPSARQLSAIGLPKSDRPDGSRKPPIPALSFGKKDKPAIPALEPLRPSPTPVHAPATNDAPDVQASTPSPSSQDESFDVASEDSREVSPLAALEPLLELGPEPEDEIAQEASIDTSLEGAYDEEFDFPDELEAPGDDVLDAPEDERSDALGESPSPLDALPDQPAEERAETAPEHEAMPAASEPEIPTPPLPLAPLAKPHDDSPPRAETREMESGPAELPTAREPSDEGESFDIAEEPNERSSPIVDRAELFSWESAAPDNDALDREIPIDEAPRQESDFDLPILEEPFDAPLEPAAEDREPQNDAGPARDASLQTDEPIDDAPFEEPPTFSADALAESAGGLEAADQVEDETPSGDETPIVDNREARTSSAIEESRPGFEITEKSTPDLQAELLRDIADDESSGNWLGVVEGMGALLETMPDPRHKFTILKKIGNIYRTKLSDARSAADAFEQALAHASDKELMESLLEIYTETSNYEAMLPLLESLAKLETSDNKLAEHHFTMALLYRDQVDDPVAAVKHYNLTLDHNPRKLQAFEAIDRLLTRASDWSALAENYAQMIERVVDRADQPELLFTLYRNLAEVYRSRLQDVPNAIRAFESAVTLQPEDTKTREMLCQLLDLQSAQDIELLDAAARHHHALLERDAGRLESFKSLTKIYFRQHRYDRAWCVCSVLHALQAGDLNQHTFYLEHRPTDLPQTDTSASPTDLDDVVLNASEQGQISAILGTVARTVQQGNAPPVKQLVKKKQRLELDSGHHVARTAAVVFDLLGLPEPELYLTDRLEFAEVPFTRENVMLVGERVAQWEPKALGALIAYHSVFLDSRYFLAATGNKAFLTNCVFAALDRVTPNSKIPLNEEAQAIRSRLDTLEEADVLSLERAVGRLMASGGQINLKEWFSHVERGALRAALLVANDLETALTVAAQASLFRFLSKEQGHNELVRFVVSQPYLELRERLSIRSVRE